MAAPNLQALLGFQAMLTSSLDDQLCVDTWLDAANDARSGAVTALSEHVVNMQ